MILKEDIFNGAVDALRSYLRSHPFSAIRDMAYPDRGRSSMTSAYVYLRDWCGITICRWNRRTGEIQENRKLKRLKIKIYEEN